MADLRKPRWQARGSGRPGRRSGGSAQTRTNFPIAAGSLPPYGSGMRRRAWLLWAVPAAGVLAAAVLGGRFGLAQRMAAHDPSSAPAAQLWIQATPLDDRQQLLLVVDPQMRNAAVYHVDGPTGTLVLKSTRNITWDLMVGDFNAQEPKPAALRRMLEVGPEARPIGQNPP